MIGPRSPPSPPPSRRRAVALADDDSPSSAVPTPCNVVVAPARAGALPSAKTLSQPSDGATHPTLATARAALRPVDPRWRAETPAPPVGRGLRNLGNSCFLNAVLQALAHTPPLARLCADRVHSRACALARANRPCAFCVVERHVNRALAYDSSGGSAPAGGGSSGVGFGAGGVWRARPSVDRWDDHDRAPSFAPHEVFDNLRLLAQHFVRYRQEDAHELLRLTLDAMDRSCLVNCGRPPVGGGSLDPANPARVMPPTVVERVFQGRFRNRVTCGGCGRDSDAHDPFLDVSLELARGVSSVDEAFDAFVAEETLEGENAYECERCGGLRPATKRLTVHEAPAVLVVHLKRFDHWGGKIDACVAFSDVVSLRGRMSDDAEESERPPVYRLYAAIVHAGGSVDGGHYYAYARRIEAGEGADDEGEWYVMDDSSVRRASLAEVREEQAYVLFYERAPGIPPPPHAVAPIESWGRDALGKESARENREDDEGDDAFASGRSTANEPSTGHLATPNPPRVPPPASARAGLAAFDPTGATALADLDEFDEHGEGETNDGAGRRTRAGTVASPTLTPSSHASRVGYGAVVGDPRSPAAAALLGLAGYDEDDEDELGDDNQDEPLGVVRGGDGKRKAAVEERDDTRGKRAAVENVANGGG